MRRREFIAGLCGAAVWPVAVRAQQTEAVRRIAVLMSGAEDDPETQARLAGIRQGLSRFGWSEGRNLEIIIVTRRRVRSGHGCSPRSWSP
jgi:putative ABC transport system substrate-binding protein